MYFLKKLARHFGERDEGFADVVWKQSCARRGECQNLQAMYYWSAMAMLFCPFDIVVNRVIIR